MYCHLQSSVTQPDILWNSGKGKFILLNKFFFTFPYENKFTGFVRITFSEV